MPKLSIIVPVYNVEKYIDKSLNSLVNQTLEDIEIIIVNDGSTDDSKKIIAKYLKNFPSKIKYFEKINGGLSSARNFGLNFATGEYVAFLDSDDYVEKDMYEEMFNKAKMGNSDMVECDFLWEYSEFVDDSSIDGQCMEDFENYKIIKVKKDKRKNYKNKKDMMRKPRVVVWNKLIKRKIIEDYKIRFPEDLIYEDLEFFYKLIPYLNKISYIEKYFVHYVQRQKSLSNVQTDKVGDIFKILNNIIDYYKANGLYEEYKIELNYLYKRILLGSSMKRILKIKNKKIKMKLLKDTFFYLKSNFFPKVTVPNEKFFPKVTVPFEKNFSKGTVPNEKKLIFGITKLGIGGAERVLVDMANNLCEKYGITIFTIYKGGELEKELNQKVRLINLYEKENKILPIYLWLFGKHIYNKNIKNKFDVEIAFLEGPITRIFSYNGKSKKIAWVHNDMKNVFGRGIKAKIKNKIDKKIYKKYNTIVFVSEDNKRSFNELYGNTNKIKEKVIYNYIDKNRVLKKAEEKIDDMAEEKEEFLKSTMIKEDFYMDKIENIPIILSVARLVKQKGIDRFIRIHKKLIDDGIIHKVYVIGDGEEKDNLQKIIKQLNVENSFILLGKRENPYPYMKMCDYFALLSYYEGYGMVIEEAKIFNKKIIITDTASKEALRGYENGVIVKNDEKDIYQNLKILLQEDLKR